MKNSLLYTRTPMLIVLDAVRLFGLSYVLCQTVFVIASALQLACFFIAIQIMSNPSFSPEWLLIIAVAFTAGVTVEYLAQSRLLAFAIEYEKTWHCRFAFEYSRKKKSGPLDYEPSKLKFRHMGTMLRNANIVASRTLLVLPFVSTVIYLAPQISLVLFALLLVLAFPLYAVNKASSLSFQNMQSSNLLDRKAGRKLDYPVYTSQNTLNFYKNMLHAPLHARLIVDIITAFTVCVGLLYVLTQEVSLSTSVMFLIGFRFLFSNISAIASSMAALNRFYGTLHELAQKYFDDDEFMKISSRNYNLNKFYQNLEGAKKSK